MSATTGQPHLASSGSTASLWRWLPIKPRLLAPFAIAAAVVTLAIAIVIGEWRDGSIGGSGVAAARDLVFETRADGRLAVLEETSGAEVVVLASASEGFVATTIKSLSRERRRFGVPESAPYRLRRWSGGRLTLTDRATGIEVELRAFGSTNSAAFDALLR